MSKTRLILRFAIVAGIALAAGSLVAPRAEAQGAEVAAAIASASVGEQADGYLGIRGAISGDLRAAVEAINIKRRAVYTDLAGKRGVTVSDVAAATGCQTLATRVRPGQAYRIGAGPWQIKGPGPIDLPDYCATAN
jgi:uncharacterized protein YdbL (DUF1318 family)